MDGSGRRYLDGSVRGSSYARDGTSSEGGGFSGTESSAGEWSGAERGEAGRAVVDFCQSFCCCCCCSVLSCPVPSLHNSSISLRRASGDHALDPSIHPGSVWLVFGPALVVLCREAVAQASAASRISCCVPASPLSLPRLGRSRSPAHPPHPTPLARLALSRLVERTN